MKRTFAARLAARIAGVENGPGRGLAVLLAGVLAGGAAASGTGAKDATVPSSPRPRLVLFLVVDQGRADYFERYRPHFRSGLARLLDQSHRFVHTFHDHAIPKTGPGHATLASGTHPRRHGIIANSWIDPQSGLEVDAESDPADGISPRRLLVPTLGDWIKAASPASQVYGVSQKARSATLLAGLRGDGAFWIPDETGRVTSSSYYPASDPASLGLSPDRLSADRFFGQLWTPIDAEELLRMPGLQQVERGAFARAFPHSFGEPTLAPDEDFYKAFSDSPWIDEMTEEVAEALVRSRRLGADDAVDLLAISFSAVDGVGHFYGPGSQEVADTLLRLDRVIGRLLDFIDSEVGLERTIISLSADHGIPPIPGTLGALGLGGRRLYGEEVACFQRLPARLAARFGAGVRISPGPFFDASELARNGLDRAAVESEAATMLESCPGVAEVFTRGELESPEPKATPEHVLFEHAFHPGRSPDLLIQLEPYSIAWTSWNTTHSSLYTYDRHVPWLLRLPGGSERAIDAEVATVDIAPTLAELLGIRPTGEVDGVSRVPLLTITEPVRKESP